VHLGITRRRVAAFAEVVLERLSDVLQSVSRPAPDLAAAAASLKPADVRPSCADQRLAAFIGQLVRSSVIATRISCNAVDCASD